LGLGTVSCLYFDWIFNAADAVMIRIIYIFQEKENKGIPAVQPLLTPRPLHYAYTFGSLLHINTYTVCFHRPPWHGAKELKRKSTPRLDTSFSTLI
jgi:hypothetical protein